MRENGCIDLYRMCRLIGKELALYDQVCGFNPCPSRGTHDAENRQRPCRMIMRHVKDLQNASLAWLLSAK
ncbi:hypothetical protein TNCV_4585031 [Trichonephila clavipes]|nr:hypothetical protein TNCV_4585031 [Trichonephila clavipes]